MNIYLNAMLRWCINNFLFTNSKKHSRCSNEIKPLVVIDGLNGNIIIDVYDSINVILGKIFKASLEEAVFSEKRKITKVIPVFKKS